MKTFILICLFIPSLCYCSYFCDQAFQTYGKTPIEEVLKEDVLKKVIDTINDPKSVQAVVDFHKQYDNLIQKIMKLEDKSVFQALPEEEGNFEKHYARIAAALESTPEEIKNYSLAAEHIKSLGMNELEELEKINGQNFHESAFEAVNDVPDFSGKPQLFFISKQNCSGCEIIKPAMAKLSHHLTEKADLFYVGSEVAKKLGINVFPTLYVRHEEGGMVNLLGGSSTEELWYELNKFIETRPIGQFTFFDARGELQNAQNYSEFIEYFMSKSH